MKEKLLQTLQKRAARNDLHLAKYLLEYHCYMLLH